MAGLLLAIFHVLIVFVGVLCAREVAKGFG
jgi:hypothetical protein